MYSCSVPFSAFTINGTSISFAVIGIIAVPLLSINSLSPIFTCANSLLAVIDKLASSIISGTITWNVVFEILDISSSSTPSTSNLATVLSEENFFKTTSCISIVPSSAITLTFTILSSSITSSVYDVIFVCSLNPSISTLASLSSVSTFNVTLSLFPIFAVNLPSSSFDTGSSSTYTLSRFVVLDNFLITNSYSSTVPSSASTVIIAVVSLINVATFCVFVFTKNSESLIATFAFLSSVIASTSTSCVLYPV